MSSFFTVKAFVMSASVGVFSSTCKQYPLGLCVFGSVINGTFSFTLQFQLCSFISPFSVFLLLEFFDSSFQGFWLI